jgi:hypothetical protein
MATLNELIAQLNASTGNILSDASRLNTTADNMNQTLDGMGVQEVSGIAELLPDERQDMYRTQIYTPEQQEYLPSTTQQVIDSSSYALPQDLGTNIPPEGILSQIKDAATNYIQSGGILGMGAKAIASLFGKMDPRQSALRQFYGYDSMGRVPQGHLMAGYSPVSGGLLNMITGGRFGEPTNYGLQRAYQKRMDTINKTLARKYADGDYSNTLLDERLVELRNLRDAEQKFVADKIGQNYTGDQDTQNVIDNTGRRDATGGDPGSIGASDQFSNKTGRGRTGY